jgi:hypothetical protein
MRGLRTLVVAAAVTVGTLPTATLQETAMKKGSTGKYADVNGLKMYYEVHGSGQPLVLIQTGSSPPLVPMLPQPR